MPKKGPTTSPPAALGETLKARGVKARPRRIGPVWAGPESPEANGGITYSLLCRFLSCRERYRLLVVEGLKTDEGFNHRLEYGSMWHTCEEAFAGWNNDGGYKAGSPDIWEPALKSYAQELMEKYPLSREDILKWYNVCRVQFPVYVDYWSRHRDTTPSQNLLQEQVFSVKYPLPSGREVYLRGKWDGVKLMGVGKSQCIYLFETKTKGDINEHQLRRQLSFDLQTMLYLVTLKLWGASKNPKSGKPYLQSPVAGVDYNVIRRPLSGGKGSIRPHQATKNKPAERMEDYYARLQEVFKEDPSYWFMRWRVEVSPRDVELFRRQCLDPVLAQLCDWWEYVKEGDPWRKEWVDDQATREKSSGAVTGVVEGYNPLHFRYPFGVWNPLAEGASSELDEYLATKSEVGLRRATNLFPELQDG